MKRKFLSLLVTIAILMSSFTTIVFATNEGTVLYDKGGIKITYQNYTVNNYGDFAINLLIENNSSKYICVQARSESINGYMIEAIMSDDVQAGKKAYADMKFSSYSLKENHISSVYDLQFSFHIFEEEGWDTIDDSQLINLSFGGINLNNGVSADTRPITTFYNKGGIKISYIDHTLDDYGDLDVNLLIENNSSKYICIQARKESINGFMVSATMSDDVQVGKKAYADMSFSSYNLKENHITSINEIEFSLHIFEEDGWDTIDDTKIYKIVNGGVQGFSATQSTNVQVPQTTTPTTSTPITNDVKVVINGEKISFDVQPTIIDGRTLVPMRAIFEKLGASVDWDGDTQTVTSVKGNTKISLTIGNNVLHINNTTKTLDVPAMLLNGRTLVPVRAISEAFNCLVDWDGNSQTVIIMSDDESMYKAFVDFVKTNGSYNDNKYGIQAEIPYHSGKSGTSQGKITLVYDPSTDELQLQVIEFMQHTDNDTTTLFVTIDLPKKSEKYDWQFQYMIDDVSYKNNDYFMASEGTIKANAESYLSGDAIKMTNIITGKEITEGSSAFNVGALVVFVPTYGNKMFSDNGSSLSFEYFGIK